ncbi:mechanosensitive ion channel family protein [Nocardioides insulae]|uniref:mechanosensitive ion channel family protein n=1 Tax=Nocardioides insulae TaxID=394734 RepID=UPI000A005D23|nr:mechanosensitive ion channel family protein [Nocardioides insulae]
MLEQLEPCTPDSICSTVQDWTGNQTVGQLAEILLGKPLTVLILIVSAVVVRWLLFKVVDRVVKQATAPRNSSDKGAKGFGRLRGAEEDPAYQGRRIQRAKTMGNVLKSVITVIIAAIFGTMILSAIGINIAPIIASAGIVGLAVGFGAQSLVKDYVSGMFMVFEDQYGVGDVIDLGEAIGTVEAVTLRVTRLRALDGTVWYVPNGEIRRVGNMSQNWSCAVVDINVGYHSDLARVKQLLQEISHDLWSDEEYRGIVVEEPTVTGVEVLGPDFVTVRLLVKTAPLEQWEIARELRQRIKTRFDYEGIEIPLPQRVVWHREEPDTKYGLPSESDRAMAGQATRHGSGGIDRGRAPLHDGDSPDGND